MFIFSSEYAKHFYNDIYMNGNKDEKLAGVNSAPYSTLYEWYGLPNISDIAWALQLLPEVLKNGGDLLESAWGIIIQGMRVGIDSQLASILENSTKRKRIEIHTAYSGISEHVKPLQLVCQ